MAVTELQIEKWKHEGDVTALVFGIRELEAEVQRLQAKNKDLKENMTHHALNYRKGKIKKLEAEVEQLKEKIIMLKTQMRPNEYEQESLDAMDEAKAPKD